MMGEYFGFIRALPYSGIYNIDNISVVDPVSPSKRPFERPDSNVYKGSQVAVGRPRMDFITGTAGIGHFWTFAPVNRAPQSRHSTVIGGRLQYFRNLAQDS